MTQLGLITWAPIMPVVTMRNTVQCNILHPVQETITVGSSKLLARKLVAVTHHRTVAQSYAKVSNNKYVILTFFTNSNGIISFRHYNIHRMC